LLPFRSLLRRTLGAELYEGIANVPTDRTTLARDIAARLTAGEDELREGFKTSQPTRHCCVDRLLDEDLVREVASRFPQSSTLMLLSSIRERKRVGVKVDEYDPLVRELLYAFQQPEVIEAVRRVTGYVTLLPDASLYNAGLSVMGTDDFLNPHIDNSHDGDNRHYRALNLLYYVSPDWTLERGGNLELWDKSVRQKTTILSAFNRLVVMETTPTSWHSVCKVTATARRYCVSSYLFSPASPLGTPYRNVTTFTGRPEEPLKRAVLLLTDRIVLNAAGRLFPWLTERTKHRLPAAGEVSHR
jgi:Rps23 Pro-64 3,4-dihydroxylase Tpa1-like proline 4-hydroxylase